MSENPRPRRLRPLLSSVVLRSQSDARLGALAAAGNQQAFTTIYERYRRELASHARRIVRPDRAEDVVQQAMFVGWSALLSGAEIADLRAWLHRVVHNAALDMVSRRGYDDSAIPEWSVAPDDTAQLAGERLDAASALAAIAALPDSQRQALTLTAIEGRTGHEAAREMGISDSAMRQLVYRARTGVRRAVTAATPVPLVNWVASAAAGPEPMAAVGMGAGGGGGATLAKVIAVLGVTAGTLGATHALQRHDPSPRARLATIRPGTANPGHPGHARVNGVPQLAAVGQGNPAAGHDAGEVSARLGVAHHDAVNGRQHQSGSRARLGDTSGDGPDGAQRSGSKPTVTTTRSGLSDANHSQPNGSVTDEMPSRQSGSDGSASQSDQSSTQTNQATSAPDQASTDTNQSTTAPTTTGASPSSTTTGSSPTGTGQGTSSPSD